MLSIGVDIGGTKIRGAVLDGTEIKDDQSIQTSQDKSTFLQDLSALIEGLLDRNPGVCGVGIGYPSVITPNGQIVFEGCVASLLGTNLIQELQPKIKTSIYVDNDANCFALAEHRYGAGRSYTNMIGLVIGSGIGCGIILNGQLWKGEYGAAGEIGHSVIDMASSVPCFCGQGYGHFAGLVAGKGFPNYYKSREPWDRITQLSDENKKPEFKDLLTSTDVLDQRIVEKTFDYRGIGIASLVNAYDISRIVLGGGYGYLPDAFYERALAATEKRIIQLKGREIQRKIELVRFQLPQMNAGVIGAAELVR